LVQHLMWIYTIARQEDFMAARVVMGNFVNGIIENESINTRWDKGRLCPL
jgi:hypothetical protein